MILPEGPLRLENITVPACLLGQPGDLIRTDLSLDAGRIGAPQAMAVDMKGALVLPALSRSRERERQP